VELRKLTIKDSESLEQLIAIIETTLENKEFWLPINEESRRHFFDGDWTQEKFHNLRKDFTKYY